MPIDVKCPGCGGSFRVAEAAAGKRFKCKSCGGPIAVPEVEALDELPEVESSGPATPRGGDAAKTSDADRWTRRWRAKIGGTATGFALRLALIAWTLLMLLIVLAWLSSLKSTGGAAAWSSEKRGVVVWWGLVVWLLPTLPLGLAAVVSTLRERGSLTTWRRRLGSRAYILLVALVGWTSLVASVTLLWMVAIIAHGFGVRSGTRMDVAAAAAGLVAFWGFCFWLFPALALGIASVVTLNKGAPSDETPEP